MWRTRAIVERVLEDLGGLGEADTEALAKARRRAVVVVVFDWLAILVLLVFGDSGDSRLSLTAGEMSLFTLGLLAVAIHSGYRLAQVHQLNRIARLVEDLEERRGE